MKTVTVERDIKTLWSLVLNRLTIGQGICLAINLCRDHDLITYKEMESLRICLSLNKPSPVKNSVFYNSRLRGGSSYWWALDYDGYFIRKNFINHLIQTL